MAHGAQFCADSTRRRRKSPKSSASCASKSVSIPEISPTTWRSTSNPPRPANPAHPSFEATSEPHPIYRRQTHPCYMLHLQFWNPLPDTTTETNVRFAPKQPARDKTGRSEVESARPRRKSLSKKIKLWRSSPKRRLFTTTNYFRDSSSLASNKKKHCFQPRRARVFEQLLFLSSTWYLQSSKRAENVESFGSVRQKNYWPEDPTSVLRKFVKFA